MTPRPRLLGAVGERGLTHERRQELGRGLAPHVVERLERLVGEVERVTAVDEHVVGDRGEDHALDVGAARVAGERGREHPLGGVRRTRVDEPPVPTLQPAGRRGAVGAQRREREPRRMVAGVARHEREPVHERERVVLGREVRQEVRHCNEHGQTRAPALGSVAGPEVETDPHDLARRLTRLEQTEHRLGDHQRESLLQAVLEAGAQVRDHVGRRAGHDEHLVGLDQHVESAGVVGEEVERAAGHEVEAGVVPVARDEPGLDRALAQREAQVRATVFDRERPAVVPEHHDGHRAELREQLAGPAQLGGRARPDLPCRRLHDFPPLLAPSAPVLTAPLRRTARCAAGYLRRGRSPLGEGTFRSRRLASGVTQSGPAALSLQRQDLRRAPRGAGLRCCGSSRPARG